MKYLILVCYILFFAWLGSELSDGMYEIAFLGGIIRGIGASRDAKMLQGRADAINPERPEYQIPAEVMEYLQNAMNMAQGDMPGYGRMMNRASGTTANTLSQARNFADSGTSLLQTLGMAGESERRNTGNIDIQNQQFRQGNMNSLQNALLTMSGYKDTQFDFNEVQPYIQEEMDKRAFEAAALDQKRASRDAWGSFADGIINTGLTIAGAPMGTSGQSLFGKIFGSKGQEQSASQYRIGQPIQTPERPELPKVNFNLPNTIIR